MQYLEALRFNENLQVVQTMKSSPSETTELVADSFGCLMVRKTIARDSGIGHVYEQLKNACDAGEILLHLPRVYAFFRTEDAVVVIMEYLQGINLWQRLDLEGCGVASARRYFPEVCAAVCELHERFNPPIIHRDLKPTNVLVSPDGNVKMLDFGISREFREGADVDTRILGTREYAPPEQFGFRQTDERSDIYSLGMMLYHILTGQTPSAGLHERGFVDPDIPEELRPVLMRATEFEPSRRFSSVREMQEAFEAAIAVLPESGSGAAPAPVPMRASVQDEASSVSPSAATSSSKASPKMTPTEIIRDFFAVIILVFAVWVCIGTWDSPDPARDVAYNAGLMMSSAVFVFPIISVAYLVSSKHFLKRLFPRLVGRSVGRDVLIAVLTPIILLVMMVGITILTLTIV